MYDISRALDPLTRFFFTAIRTGRYTYQTKTLYAEEVEKLKLQARLCKSESVLLTSDERQRELEDMVELITTEHLKQTPTNEFFEGLAEREATFLVRFF